MSSNAIVLSIRPQYAKKIFEGIKTVELRRTCPKHIRKGTLVLIYVSSPVQSLAGAFKIEEIVKKPLGVLWDLVKDYAGIGKEDFDEYFQDINTGIGIFFKEVWFLNEPIKIQDWAEQGISFQPPQGFRYATIDELASPQIAELVEDNELILQSSLLR